MTQISQAVIVSLKPLQWSHISPNKTYHECYHSHNGHHDLLKDHNANQYLKTWWRYSTSTAKYHHHDLLPLWPWGSRCLDQNNQSLILVAMSPCSFIVFMLHRKHREHDPWQTLAPNHELCNIMLLLWASWPHNAHQIVISLIHDAPHDIPLTSWWHFMHLGFSKPLSFLSPSWFY